MTDRKIPVPLNESARLEALKSLRIMDTAPSEVFDEITQAAASSYDTPIALVSLVDAHRQWFKSRTGLEAPETPRDISFCTYAIMEPDELLVSNALEDERFRHNPLVTGEPNIQFYAGIPLKLTEGITLGTLCIIDRKPRPDITDLTALKALAEKTLELIVEHADQATADITLELGDTVEFSFEVVQNAASAVVRLRGELGWNDASDFYRGAMSQIDRNATQLVVLDFSGCSHLDKQGFGAVMQLSHAVQDAGIAIQYTGASDSIEAVFTSLGVEKLLKPAAHHSAQPR